MGVLDKFLNAIRLNDDYDDDDEFYDDEDDYEEDEKPKKRFFQRMKDDDYDDDDEDDYKSSRKEKTASSSKQQKNVRQPKTSASKVTPIRKKPGNSNGMEVCVIKPTSMEDTSEIADTLRDKCTVVLNLEGIDVELAQRIIDFSSGACYALDGNLQMVSSYIFILTPYGIEISGDYQDILNGQAPSMRRTF